ncbi:hypothetical protein PIB30_058496 [Stylosanthes scabra]|uniref:Uncharacterized protein n=1 Tax=Stylosanthes scabra TaxID=79078 RepID=A0ABU6TLL2_9FABA|nr:hypothetical protein [Stylosanthes scabra]
MDQNVCLDVSDDDDDVFKVDRTTITCKTPCKPVVHRSTRMIKCQKMSTPQSNGKGKSKPLSKTLFPEPGAKRSRFQQLVQVSKCAVDMHVHRGEASSTQSSPRVRAESKPLSFFGQQNMLVRKKPKAVVLSDVITSSHFADCPFKHADFSGGWSTRTIDVVDNVQPHSKCTNNSAIWVLSWLHIEYSFNSEISPMISEHQVLVTTTIDLVLGASNKLRRTVMENASEHWVRLNHP